MPVIELQRASLERNTRVGSKGGTFIVKELDENSTLEVESTVHGSRSISSSPSSFNIMDVLKQSTSTNSDSSSDTSSNDQTAILTSGGKDIDKGNPEKGKMHRLISSVPTGTETLSTSATSTTSSSASFIYHGTDDKETNSKLTFSGITASLSHSSSEMIGSAFSRFQKSHLSNPTPLGRTVTTTLKTAIPSHVVGKSRESDHSSNIMNAAEILSNQKLRTLSEIDSPTYPQKRAQAILQNIGTTLTAPETMDGTEADEDDQRTYAEDNHEDDDDYDSCSSGSSAEEWQDDAFIESRGLSLLDALGTAARNDVDSDYLDDGASYSEDEENEDDNSRESIRSFGTFKDFPDDGISLLGSVLYNLGTCNLSGARDVFMQEEDDDITVASEAFLQSRPVIGEVTNWRKGIPTIVPCTVSSSGGLSTESSTNVAASATYLGFNEERERQRFRLANSMPQMRSSEKNSFFASLFGTVKK